MSFLIGALKIIFLLGFLVFIHEGAHFLVAKKCNVAVREFSIGFGPKIFSKKKNETNYSIRAIPLGGFVDMYEDDINANNENILKENNANSFLNSSKSKRFAITIAGIVVNVLFGFLIYFILQCGVQNVTTTIDRIDESAQSNLAMLQGGDTIKEVNGQKIRLKSQIDIAIASAGKEEAELKIERNGIIQEVKIPVKKITNEENNTVSYRLGVYMKKADKTFENQVYYAFWKTAYFAEMLGKSVSSMFKGNINPNEMVGPIGISEMIVETDGFYEFFYLLAVVSISLGVTNLLPIPGLDGGRLLLIIVEAIRRKPLKRETEAQIQLLGFSFLIMLSIYVAFNDVVRIM